MRTQLRHLWREVDNRLGDAPAPPLLSVSQTLGVVRRELISDKPPRADSFDKYKVCEAGDLVLNRFNAYRGSLGISNERGIVSPDYLVLRANPNSHPKFLDFLLRSDELSNFMKSTMGGLGASDPDVSGFSRIDTGSLGQYSVPTLDSQKQRGIAHFLDRETAQIDELMGKQERLIELLAEKRQAIITHAVTKGLDPAAPTKPSGVPWLGEVGAGWTLVKLKHVVDVLTGFPFKSEEFSEQPEDLRLLRGVNINPGKTNWADTVRFAESQSRDYANYRLELGDLVLGLDRPLVSDGTRVCAIGKQDLPSLLVQRVARIRTSSHANQEFIGHLLSSSVFANYLEPLFTGVSVPHMSPGQLGDFKIALPRLEVQKDIARGLRLTLNKIDVLKDRAERVIMLLRERRSALISAAVTGKIDVQEGAAQL